ncbi:MAG: hypothetical protein IPL61_36405 [Myxococcales bacterium]|nr:hypothetical protein [Myxococcales bacterium]
MSFEGHLQGPQPWRVDGKACLSLWFIDLCVPVHVRFGDGAPATVPARQIWPALQAALAEPAAWAAEVPRGWRRRWGGRRGTPRGARRRGRWWTRARRCR